uniref:Uncharacterized protein n=3 Tax=Schistocephalus solidus TaxID=70667 RepID=A0A0X3P8D1_SCHSO
MTRTALKNQIQDLTDRLDELNRITRICAMGTPFEETGCIDRHVLLPILRDKDDPPLADHFPPQLCALQPPNLYQNCEPNYAIADEDRCFPQSHITCLNSLERMPSASLQPFQSSQLPLSPSNVKSICDAHILQSDEILKLQERQFNLQDHLMELMHRVQHRECPGKPPNIRDTGPPVREHDVDEHVKVLNTGRSPGTLLTSANRNSSVSQRTTKHPASLSRNNSAVESLGSKRRLAWSPGTQGRSPKPTQSLKEVIPSTKTATERELNAPPAEEIPMDLKSLSISPPQDVQEGLGDKTELLEIKKELSLLREIFAKELEDVRSFLQENREEIERSRRTTQELQSTKEEKENFEPENQQSNLSDGSHFPTENVENGLQASRFRQLYAPPPVNSTLLVAQKTLREVEQRRNNLETNISAFERSRKCQGFFDILDMLGKDEDAVERARIKAMVDDAISNIRSTPPVSRPITTTSAVRRAVDDAPRRARGRGVGVGVRGRFRDAAKPVPTSPVRPAKPPTLASIISLSPPQKPTLQFPLSARSKSPEPKATAIIATPASRSDEAGAPPPTGVLHVPQQQRRPAQVAITRKAVRFDDGVLPNSGLAESNLESSVRPRSPPRRRTIQPLGMRQYSMCPLEQPNPPAKPAQDVDHQEEIGTGLIFNHLPGVDPPKAFQPSSTEVLSTDSILHRRMEEEVVSRLLRQLALAFSQPQTQAPTPLASTSRSPNLRDLVETALLERVAQGDLLTPLPLATTEPCRERSPDPSVCKSAMLESSLREPATEEISAKAPSSISTAPPHVSVRDRSASARPLSSPSTLTSLPRRQLSQHSRAISVQSFLQRVEEKASEHSAQNVASSMLDDNEDRTLDEQPPLSLSGTTSPLVSLGRPQPSMRSEAVSAHDPALPQSPALVSEPPRTLPPTTVPPPVLTPPPKSTAEIGVEVPVSPPSTAITKSQSPEMSSVVRPSSFSSTLSEGPPSEWSLTAPHSFSDGVWLEERSEGEAAHYSLYPSTAAKLGPLPLTDSEELNSTDSKPKECGAEESNSSTTSVGKLSCGELTVDKLTKRNSAWVAPWRNPLLHLMALNAAGSNSRLPWNRFVEIQRTAAALRSHQLRQHQTAGGGDATETTPTPVASDLGWLKETLADLETGSACPRRHSDPETSDLLSAGEIRADFVEKSNRVLYSDMREPFSQAKGDTKELVSASRPPESLRQVVCEAEGPGGIALQSDSRPTEGASETTTTTSNNQVSYDEEPQENCNCATDTSSGEGTKRSLLLAVREFSDDENEEDNEVDGETNEEKQMPEDAVNRKASNNEEYSDRCAVGGSVSPTATSVTTTQWASVSHEAPPCQGSPDADQHPLLLSTARDSFPGIMEEEEASTSTPPPPPQLISTPRLLSRRQDDAEQTLLWYTSRTSSGGSEEEEEDAGQHLSEWPDPPNENSRLDAECLRFSTPPESLLDTTDLPSTQQLLDNALRQTISLNSSFGEEEAGEGVTDTTK